MGSPAETALRLVKKKGRADGVLRRPSADQVVENGRPWAPQDADPTAAAPLHAGMSIVVLDIAVLDDRDAQALAAGSTAVGYVPALDLPEGVTVESGDLVETGGDRYMVLRADLLAPSSDPILYTLSLKGR